MKSIRFLLALAALSTAGLVRADVLRLKNGDTLTGKVTKQEGGKIQFKGTYFGDITIAESDIASYKIGDNVTAADLPAPAAGAAAAAAPATSAAGGVGSATIPTVAGAAGADPAKAVWSRSLTVGGSYVSAPYEQGNVRSNVPGLTVPNSTLQQLGRQISVQFTGALVRTTATDAQSLEASYTYADYEPYAAAVADTWSGTFAWNHTLSPKHYTVSRTSYSADKVKNIDHSFYQLFGVGTKVINTAKTKLDFVPGLILVNEEKRSIFDNEWKLGYGFLENFSYAINAYASFEQRLTFRNLFDDSKYYTADAYVGFKGMLSAKLGVEIGLTYNYDNTADLRPLTVPGVPAGVFFYPNKNGVLTLKSGFQIKY